MALRAALLAAGVLAGCAAPQAPARTATPPSSHPDAAGSIPLHATGGGPDKPYTVIGAAEAREPMRLDSAPEDAELALRAAIRRQAAQARADAVLELSFTDEQRWLPPIPPSTTPRRQVHRVARGLLVRYQGPENP